MQKNKMQWWKILLIILFLPIAVIYYGFKYAIKFYDSNRFTTKQKIIYTIIGICVLACLNVAIDKTRGPKIQNAEISDVTLYKGSSKKVNIIVTPKKSKISETEYSGYDSNVISIDEDKIKAKSAGETTVICKVTDYNGKSVKSNKFKVTVNLTEKQIAEEKKKAEEAAAKAAQELEEKRNSLSLTESIRIKDKSKDIIDKLLKAPSTAEYPGSFLDPLEDWKMSKKNNLVTVASYVDAENSFGAKIRNNFIIQVQMNDDGSGTVTYVQLGDRVITGKFNENV